MCVGLCIYVVCVCMWFAYGCVYVCVCVGVYVYVVCVCMRFQKSEEGYLWPRIEDNVIA